MLPELLDAGIRSAEVVHGGVPASGVPRSGEPVTGALEGWRWWRVSPDGVLASPIDRILWPTAVFAAGCQSVRWHVVPHEGCTCGVYGFTRIEDVRGHMRATNLLRALLPELSAIADWPIVVGTVELTGGAVVAKRPPESACVELKAASARILRLEVDDANDHLAGQLAARYGVPVQPR